MEVGYPNHLNLALLQGRNASYRLFCFFLVIDWAARQSMGSKGIDIQYECIVRRAHNTYGDRCFATAGRGSGTLCRLNCNNVALSDNLNGV